MATIFIFHGVEGSPDENWFPWLKTELQKAGHTARVPRFPHADHPELQEWIAHFERKEPPLNAETILVGHSLGSAFALRLLERSPTPVLATFLVAPVWSVMGNKFDPLMTSFTLRLKRGPLGKRRKEKGTLSERSESNGHIPLRVKRGGLPPRILTTAPYDWETIRKNTGDVHVIGSDNDPYITLEKTEVLALHLRCSVTLIKNGGHFNEAAGFTEFPMLLSMILKSRTHNPPTH